MRDVDEALTDKPRKHALMKCLSVMYLLLSSFDTCFAPGTNRNLGYFGALVRISERFDQKSQLAVLLKESAFHYTQVRIFILSK